MKDEGIRAVTMLPASKVVERNDPEGYSLQVRKFGNKSPEMLWAHGLCLREVIPVVEEEIPGPQHTV